VPEPRKGRLLVATPALREPPFARSVVAILEHDPADGTLGVVLNAPLGVPVEDVLPDVAGIVSPPAELFSGGPVSRNTAIALGLSRPDAVAPAGADRAAWEPIDGPLVTVDLDADPDLLVATLSQLRVFVGYAGWSAGQLAAEIAEGSWYVLDGLPLDPFLVDPSRLWPLVLRRQGWPLAAVAVAPLDPTMN
jgi:putative transcriptional regulator